MLLHVILGLLRDGRPRHGHELMSEYRARSGAKPSAGNFYRELARMTADGFVQTGVNPPGADARRIPYPSPPEPARPRPEQFVRSTTAWLALGSITILALAWRLLLFSGDGLGDDPSFFVAYHGALIQRWFKSAYNYRFGQLVPVVVALKLGGVNEYSWIAPIITAAVAAIPVAYALGARLSSRRAGLVAAVLLAANPLDTLVSTLFVTDTILALYLALSVVCFLRADATGTTSWYVAAAFLVVVSYYGSSRITVGRLQHFGAAAAGTQR